LRGKKSKRTTQRVRTAAENIPTILYVLWKVSSILKNGKDDNVGNDY